MGIDLRREGWYEGEWRLTFKINDKKERETEGGGDFSPVTTLN